MRNLITALIGLLLAAVPARAQLVANTYFQASSVTITGNLCVGTAAPAVLVDVRGGGINMEQNPVEALLCSAVQTGAVTTGSVQVFSAVTGATCSFTLPRIMIVHMRASGSATGASGAHCGMGFTVDGTPQGDPSWGDVIFYTTTIWASWSAEREVVLSAAAHTIALEQVSNTASGCATNTNGYSVSHLWIYAR